MSDDSLFTYGCEVRRWQAEADERCQDRLIVEQPVAFEYNGISHAVMMATPNDLEDFALGFSLTEQILQSRDELRDLSIVSQQDGITLQLTISSHRLNQLKQRRRSLTGRSGCGLCGAESLQQAIRPIPKLKPAPLINDRAIQLAVGQLQSLQPLQAETGACHGAAWCSTEGEIILVREDVGRHNALDKLIGALHQGQGLALDGFVLVSSRASYEMVSKAAIAGISSLVAVSAPTSLALKLALDCGLQLVGFARSGRHVEYTLPHK